MSTEVMLAAPPIVRQGNQHICWASAYESWARAQGRRVNNTADRIVWALSQVGSSRQGTQGRVLDRDQRLLTDGVAIFGQMAGMQIEMVRPQRFTAEFLAGKLQRGHVWQWGTPRQGNVAHVVVVYGITSRGVVFHMDPLLDDYQRTPISNWIQRFRIFAVGVSLLGRPANPFRGTNSREVHRPGGNPLFPSW